MDSGSPDRVEFGVSTPCGAVSTPGSLLGTTVFVPVLLELSMHRRICGAGMGPYPPRAALAHAGCMWLDESPFGTNLKPTASGMDLANG